MESKSGSRDPEQSPSYLDLINFSSRARATCSHLRALSRTTGGFRHVRGILFALSHRLQLTSCPAILSDREAAPSDDEQRETRASAGGSACSSFFIRDRVVALTRVSH